MSIWCQAPSDGRCQSGARPPSDRPRIERYQVGLAVTWGPGTRLTLRTINFFLILLECDLLRGTRKGFKSKEYADQGIF